VNATVNASGLNKPCDLMFPPFLCCARCEDEASQLYFQRYDDACKEIFHSFLLKFR
jgi:hypothetical protein